MTDLQARLVAALNQVRTSTPHGLDCRFGDTGFGALTYRCACGWQARVDARLAACVEAMLLAGAERAIAPWAAALLSGDEQAVIEAGLAAFLAAAAQEETQK